MPKAVGHRLRGFLSVFANVDGLGGIEFGLLMPVFLMLTVCTIDLGMGFYDVMQLENAAQAGSEYAAVHGYHVGAISSAITSATGLSGVSAAPAPTEFCGCPGSSSVATATCGSTCPDGSYTGTYVTTSATLVYRTFLHYPLLPAQFTFVNSATARIQ
jgi:Flp pilus assembly protein TadG